VLSRRYKVPEKPLPGSLSTAFIEIAGVELALHLSFDLERLGEVAVQWGVIGLLSDAFQAERVAAAQRNDKPTRQQRRRG
jgi:hypothetical protein